MPRALGKAMLFVGAAGAAVLGLSLAGGEARACGGLFCNTPPVNPFDPLPVAQSGENVVFAVDRDAAGTTTIAAHVQIFYTGPVDKFSWVVPVEAVPELSTGTDQLFTSLAGPTRPTFAATYVTDGSCRPYGGAGGSYGTADASAVFGGTGAGGAGGSSGPAVSIAFQGAVGPYDAAVIQSNDAAALEDWLTTNGYYLDPGAGQIIDTYVSEGKYFVALKLLNGQGVRSIRPIVLTFHGTDPCVPLRLTAIAALPDMPITVYLLGPARAVPQGYYELELDELRIDWWSGGSLYPTLLGQAANEAGGNAFITEYAGSSTVARGLLWSEGRYDVGQLRAAQTPPAFLQVLVGMGIASDPQMLPLLTQYIPMPAEVAALGITPGVFYANISIYWAQYAFPPFDLATLTDQIVATILEPRRLAQAMIDGHPYLTRLATFISPDEMKSDPRFVFNPDLGDVSSLHTAVLRTMCGDAEFLACNAPVRLELPDGRMAWVRRGSTSSTCQALDFDTSLGQLPAAEVVWERDPQGEGSRRIDNTAVIQAALTAHNSAFPAESLTFPIPSSGSGSPAGQAKLVSNGGGCGCDLGGSGARGALGLAVAFGLAAAIRRRRRP